MDQEMVDQLVAKSKEVMANAYCPYSNFPVGAALLCDDGSIYTGCNVENAATNGICAERTAVVKAVSAGKRKFIACAVSSKISHEFIGPCGVCRQFLAEFGLDTLMILTKSDGTLTTVTLKELLPMAFTASSLSTD